MDIGKKGNLHYQSNKDLLTYSWKAQQLASKLIKKTDYDLVHAFFGIPCGYIAMKLGLPDKEVDNNTRIIVIEVDNSRA